jgi:hypothetical protein
MILPTNFAFWEKVGDAVLLSGSSFVLVSVREAVARQVARNGLGGVSSIRPGPRGRLQRQNRPAA